MTTTTETATGEAILSVARFSETIRSATSSDHRIAERSDFMSDLMAGRLGRADYAQMSVQLWFVYDVIERAALAMVDDSVAGPFVHPELARLGALEADLAVLIGDDWRDGASMTPATEAYVTRLGEVCFAWPAGFVAHHYTRYLGDLSGGVFIGRTASGLFDLSADRGATFYHFAGIADPTAFKNAYRADLDAMELGADERVRMIDEIHAAYRHNTEMLLSLGR